MHNPYKLINEELVDIEDYLEKMKQNSFYADDLEISKTKDVLKLNIAVYQKFTNNNTGDITYKPNVYYENDNTGFINDLMIVLYQPEINHYTQLHYLKINANKKNYFNNINNDLNKPKMVNDKGNEPKEDEEIVLEIKNMLKNYKHKILAKKSNENTNNLNLNFDDKKKLGYRFPKYPNNIHGDKLLFYIRNYLISRKLNPKNPKYPSYITRESIEVQPSLRRNFRRKASNYDLDKNNDLYYKYFRKNSKDKKFSSQNKDYILCKIPFEKNILEYLFKIHKENNHRCGESLRLELLKRNIYYFGIIKDINKIVKNCAICSFKKNTKLRKREKIHIIIFNKPKIRYIGDLTDILIELIKNNKFKYIFTIIDHFFKLSNSYLLINKKAESILNAIKEFFEIYGQPLEFGCDNGREFVNESVMSYLNETNIKMIKGSPYNPHSQDIVERIHITIRKALLSRFLERQINFDIARELPLIMNSYNNSIHRVTKHTPFEIFYSQNKELFFEVYQNTKEYFEKRQKDSISYDMNEKCLLINNITKSKKIQKDILI